MGASLISIVNHGPLVRETNYWTSPLAEAGKVFVSVNAGAIRVLLPPQHYALLADMRAAKECVLSRGPWPETGIREAVELMWDDGSRSPFALHLTREAFDMLPGRPEPGREWVCSVWTAKHGRPHKSQDQDRQLADPPRPQIHPLFLRHPRELVRPNRGHKLPHLSAAHGARLKLHSRAESLAAGSDSQTARTDHLEPRMWLQTAPHAALRRHGAGPSVRQSGIAAAGVHGVAAASVSAIPRARRRSRSSASIATMRRLSSRICSRWLM
jgi:hypothetical protein